MNISNNMANSNAFHDGDYRAINPKNAIGRR